MFNYKKLMRLGCGIAFALAAQIAYGQFTLNWAPQGDFYGTEVPFLNCNRGTGASGCNIQTPRVDISDPDKTPIFQERVLDAATGQRYYHIIIGTPNSSFAQEVYILQGGAQFFDLSAGRVGSTSMGSNFEGVGLTPFINQKPLDNDETISGNATGNPTRVIMRQINSDDQMTLEFLKENFNNKPKITQTITAPDISSVFSVDMSNLNYSDKNTAATGLINQLQILSAGIPIGAGSFDIATGAQLSTITAGQYDWTPGVGPGQSGGTYNYLTGAFDVFAEDWLPYRHPAENPPYKPNCAFFICP